MGSFCPRTKNDFPPTTEMFKGSHTDTVLENNLLQTTKRFKFSDECQIRELAESLQPKKARQIHAEKSEKLCNFT